VLNRKLDLSALNEEQRRAVEHIEGPTLVLAGAGSGKTRALTHKIAYLVMQGVKPWKILAVTFTNKAAREMSSRVEKLLNIPVEGLWIGTFHGICVRILRREADRWGFRRDFTIYDRDDQLAAVKKAMSEVDSRGGRMTPTETLNAISRAKSDFLGPEELEERLRGPASTVLPEIFRRYEKLLREAGAFDFDDLLLKPVEMFGRFPESLAEWRRRFDYVLVDEFQDTNRTQYILMRMLTGDSGRITAVGDDDQSIYSWRGADIENILSFERDFKNVRTFRLERNYRSTKTIIEAANSVVANNRNRMGKKLWTDNESGEPIKILECGSDRDEAVAVVRSIEREMADYALSPGDFVILYRTNSQSRLFEDVLVKRGIRYTIVGGVRFYDRKEVKDILAYLRLIVNPADFVSFSRAVTNPKRGIGAKTIEKLERLSSRYGIDVIEALGRAAEAVTSRKLLKKLGEFRLQVQFLRDSRGKTALDEYGKMLLDTIHYREYLREEYPGEYEERMDNVYELINAMGEFRSTGDGDALSNFLNEVALMTDVDSWDDGKDVVTLMTLHAAKGLEFPSVYITGVEENLFPSLRSESADAERELEEERRLFYVGMTRAEKYLHMSYAALRRRFNTFSGGPSMFIDELPRNLLAWETAETLPPVKSRITKVLRDFEDYPQEYPEQEDVSPFAVGSYIRHPKFGRGRIEACSGSGEDIVLTVRFGSRTKKIMPNYVRLTPA